MNIRNPRALLSTLALALTLAGCDKVPPLSGPSERVPTRLEFDLGTAPLYTGESMPLLWHVYDQNDESFDHVPGWVAPQWTVAKSIVRLNNNRIEALESGQTSLTLTVAGMTATKNVRVNPGALFVNVEGAYITQGIQRFDGSLPLVAGRGGVLRVFVTGDQVNFFRPSVRARFFNSGVQIAELSTQAGAEGVPETIAEGFISHSWNLAVPGTLVAPGVSFLVEVETDGFMRPATGSILRFPASGVPRTLDARVVAPFRITFVPIHINNYATGDVTSSNVNFYMQQARLVWPFNEVDVVVREPYSTNTRSATDDDWSNLLQETAMLRVADGSSRYYHGILRREGAWAGLGYVGFPVAITQDGSSDWTVAHELGHNLGRRHAPCGGPSGVDTSYPYSTGGIGMYGLAPDGITVYPPSRADLMTYCSPRWVSDYSFLGALAFRQSHPTLDPAPGPAASVATGTMLMVSGRVGSGGARLSPAFTLQTAASLPSTPGPYKLEGRDANGTVLLSISFAGESLGDGPEDIRHFAFAIPITPENAGRLARISLSGAGQSAELSVANQPAGTALRAAADAASAISVVATAPGVVSLVWDATRYPLVVVRNPATGALLAMGRGGSVAIRTSAPELELSVSDGVRSTSSRVTVR